MSKDKIIGYAIQLPDSKCGFCGGKKDLNQYEVVDKMKGLPVTKVFFVCMSCAKKKGLPHYPVINV